VLNKINGASGGTRTLKPNGRQILSLLRIPIPPPRHILVLVSIPKL
jgi:hypothetical protein